MARERILITFNEAYDKDFHLYGPPELFQVVSKTSKDASQFFSIVWHGQDYDRYQMGKHGLTVYHFDGRCFYPWASIQEIDFMPEKGTDNG